MDGQNCGGRVNMEAVLRAELQAAHARLLRSEEQVERLAVELQAAKDRASTSYREGYEAGRKHERAGLTCEGRMRSGEDPEQTACDRCGASGGFMAAGMRHRDALAFGAEAAPVLAPKAANIWEVVEMMASLTASMRGLAEARDAAEDDARHWRANSSRAGEAVARLKRERWDLQAELDQLRDQLRLLTKECDEWREEAMALKREDGHGVSVPKINRPPES